MAAARAMLAGLLLLVGALALAACKNVQDDPVERSVFRVLALKTMAAGSRISTGTAFKVLGPATAVTNSHVVRGSDAIMIVYWQAGKYVEAEAVIVDDDPVRDIAILRSERELPGAPLPLALYSAASGSEAWALGFPGAVDLLFGVRTFSDLMTKLAAEPTMAQPTRTFGTVSNERMRDKVSMIQHQVPINTGNSGGPLVDACGAVIGVNTLFIANANSIFGAVSSREVVDTMRLKGLSAVTAKSRCWIMFEPRYMTYSMGALAALALLVAVGLVFLGWRLVRGRSRGAARRRAPAAAAAAGRYEAPYDAPLDPRPDLRQANAAKRAHGHVIEIVPVPIPSGPEEVPVLARQFELSRGERPGGAAKLVPLAGGASVSLQRGMQVRSLTVGRESDCEIFIDHPTVSRRHARIEIEPAGQVGVVDLSSANGTWINGGRISRRTLLPGERLRFGSVEFAYEAPSAAPRNPPAPAPVQAPVSWLLSCTDDSGSAVSIRLQPGQPKQSWIVGRAQGKADLVVRSPTVSSQHATIRFAPDGKFEIQDLGSSNGTTVNGQRLGNGWTAIDESSRMRIGGCELRLARG